MEKSYSQIFKFLNRILFLLFLICFYAPFGFGEKISMTAPSKETYPPFYAGVWTGADPVKWGYLPGTSSESGIQDICADLHKNGFNAVWVSGFDGKYADVPLMQTWLDASKDHGLKTVLQGNGGNYAIQKDVVEPDMLQHLETEVIPSWRTAAKTVGEHPALLAYVPVEEITDDIENGDTSTLKALAKLGNSVEEVDPHHPVITVHIPSWFAIARAEVELRGKKTGVLVTSLYPFINISDWSDPNIPWKTPEEATHGFLESAWRYSTLGRTTQIPTWIMAQGFGSVIVRKKEGQRENHILPSPAQIRFQIWASIITGAKGIFFFTYHSFPELPDEIKERTTEWELDTGLYTLDGKATGTYQALAETIKRLNPYFDLIGRLQPDSDMGEVAHLLISRVFYDPKTQNRYVIFLNRNLAASQMLAHETKTPFGIFQADTLVLYAGEGSIFKLDGNSIRDAVYTPPTYASDSKPVARPYTGPEFD